MYSSQTAALRALELGSPLSPLLTLRAELTFLTHYHPPATPFDTRFRPHPTSSPLRNSHITAIASSTDGTLAAIASTDGCIEIHELQSTPLPSSPSQSPSQLHPPSSTASTSEPEPEPESTHRLTLGRVTPNTRLSAAAFFPDTDIIATAAYDSQQQAPELHIYDIEVCQPDRPSAISRIKGTSKKPITDIVALQYPCCIGVRPNQLAIFDVRNRSRAEMGRRSTSGTQPAQTAFIPCVDPVVTVDEENGQNLIFVAEGCHILAYDRRKLPSDPLKSSSLPLSLTMGGGGNGNSIKHGNNFGVVNMRGVVDSVTLPLCKRARYNWICAPPRAPPGILAFHSTDGTFGIVDWPSRNVSTLKEKPPSTSPKLNEELSTYGTMEAALSRSAWYIRRRRGDVICAKDGRGWRFVVPNTMCTGVRVVAVMGGDSNIHQQNMFQFDINAARHIDVASVCAVEGALDKIVLGTTRNDVVSLHVDVDKTWREVNERRRKRRSTLEEKESSHEANSS